CRASVDVKNVAEKHDLLTGDFCPPMRSSWRFALLTLGVPARFRRSGCGTASVSSPALRTRTKYHIAMELLAKSRQELRELCAQRKFDFAAMSNLPVSFREQLAKEARITLPEIKQRYGSRDGSTRYLLELPPRGEELATRAASVEAVFMPSEGRQTICVSTQAGCAVECRFCLTARLGLVRNLTAGEIIAQVLLILEEQKSALAPQTNVVLMGQGEPLLNFENVMAALRILLDAEGVGLSPKHVTLSTSGIVPGIERLGGEPVRPKLAISLNASNDEQRNALMPINKK